MKRDRPRPRSLLCDSVRTIVTRAETELDEAERLLAASLSRAKRGLKFGKCGDTLGALTEVEKFNRRAREIVAAVRVSMSVAKLGAQDREAA